MAKKKCLSERLLDIGVGSFFYIKDKAGEVMSEIESRGEENRGKVEEMEEEIKTACKKRIKAIRDLSDSILDCAGIATKRDIEEIKSEIRPEKKGRGK